MHEQIIKRLHEDFGVPANASNAGQPGGDSTMVPGASSEKGAEPVANKEETREVKIANNILRAAAGLAKTNLVDTIIRQAEELKRMHAGVSK